MAGDAHDDCAGHSGGFLQGAECAAGGVGGDVLLYAGGCGYLRIETVCSCRRSRAILAFEYTRKKETLTAIWVNFEYCAKIFTLVL